MIIHLTKDKLEWAEVQHHEDFARLDTVLSVLQTEVFYYKNDEVTIRATIKIIEHSDREQPFEVLSNSYAHVHPEMIRMELSDSKKLGNFVNLEEAKDAAQVYFNHHHHTKFHAK